MIQLIQTDNVSSGQLSTHIHHTQFCSQSKVSGWVDTRTARNQSSLRRRLPPAANVCVISDPRLVKMSPKAITEQG